MAKKCLIKYSTWKTQTHKETHVYPTKNDPKHTEDPWQIKKNLANTQNKRNGVLVATYEIEDLQINLLDKLLIDGWLNFSPNIP